MIEIQNLSWKPATDYILKDITANMDTGIFYGIIGPNGSGKTSLLRHIIGITESKEGNVNLNGVNISKYKRKDLAQEICWVPQNTSIDVSFAAYDIVMMGRTSYFKTFQSESIEDKKVVQKAMEMMNCWHIKDKQFRTLSGGEAQRVIAARAVAQDAKAIVLDEPISHLDIRHQKELMEAMQILNVEQGKTVITVLHDLNIAAQYCTELFLMNKGKVFAYGASEDVLTEKNLLEVYGVEFHRIRHPSTGKLYLIPS